MMEFVNSPEGQEMIKDCQNFMNTQEAEETK